MDRWLGNVYVIRVVAVLLAVMLWLIVRFDMDNSGAVTKPATESLKYTDASISITGLDENRYTLLSIEPQKVNLEVSGTASALRKINTRDYKVVLDLTGAKPGEQLMPLSHAGFPGGVEVSIDPPNVYVTLEEKQRKEIPVTVNITGEPADGYKAGEPVVEPNRVNVTVSGSVAEEIRSIVGVVSVAGATATVKDQVRLVALDGQGQPVDVAISPPVVDVEVPVTSPFKTVPLQIKLNGAPPPGLAVGSFEQSAAEVTVYGAESFLNSLEFYDGLAVDLGSLTQTTDFNFDIPLKDGVERVSPDSVTARITIVNAMTATVKDIPLTINGKSDEYSYRVISPADTSFDVSVEAAPDIVQNLSSDDVKAIVNVSNMPPGTHELPVEYNLPSFVKTVPGNVNYVTVEIAAKAEDAAAAPAPATDGSSEENPVPPEQASEGEAAAPDEAGGAGTGADPSSAGGSDDAGNAAQGNEGQGNGAGGN
ncbi:CdaR family protein [Paenibacillus alkalitolerans]|uniref:CdaR family protein n=1 Tax=Paenibacillus alkalitolerans TaxID=2799335 RepID=UPI0018F29D7F|nr:CdaR family protein [Paenibacillus alkalitolerans]